MYNYGPIAATAIRLISEFGRTVTLRTIAKSGTSYDPILTNTDTSIKAVVTAFKASEIDGTLIMATDKKLITTSAVTTVDKIIDGSIEYSIVAVDEVKPATTALVYKAVLRR